MSINSLEFLAAVLPRYGAGLGGGAETLVRALLLELRSGRHAEILSAKRIEVWTTCALDHRTWENELPTGMSEEDDIVVRRFPVDTRNIDVFLRAEISMREGLPLTVDEQLNWLQAGVNSRALYEHIVNNVADTDAVLFAPYLFPTSYWGALLSAEKAMLVPCLHNEHYAYQSVMSHLFRKVRGLIFNAEPELTLASELYGAALIEGKGTVVGMGFEAKHIDDSRIHVRKNPYILYSGRKEEGKNVNLLLQWFTESRKYHPELELVLIGSGTLDFLKELPDGVVDLGFVSEEEKLSFMKNALALCQLSVNESFSIVLMEAWLSGCPVIVHAQCPVTRFHAVSSGGGLYCDNANEFVRVIDLLSTEADLCESLAKAGREYVEVKFSWRAVMERFAESFRKVGILRSETLNDSCDNAGLVCGRPQ